MSEEKVSFFWVGKSEEEVQMMRVFGSFTRG